MKKAYKNAEYCRVDTKGHEDESLEMQKSSMAKYAPHNGIEIIADCNCSGCSSKSE